jgi:2-iminoacetate synthase ThiH
MKTYKYFKPNGDLMKQLSQLTKENGKQWYEEYMSFHKGVDQGVNYLIGYFPEKRANQLRKILNIEKFDYSQYLKTHKLA